MKQIGVGLYGANGHQITQRLAGHPRARPVAVAAMDPSKLPDALRANREIRQYATLADMLGDERVELVSLCSPVRRDQARDAVLALRAGKHVYAEKPAAMDEAELDAVLGAAAAAGRRFHEMAGTAFEQPYLAMRSLVRAGAIGPVVQIIAQKSYPFAAWRPENEDADGGLLMQVGVHAFRFVEHVAGERIASVSAAMETQQGNRGKRGLRMAASASLALDGGGIAAVVCNYLNSPAFPTWGNEMLRIFGVDGFIEATDGGARTRLVLTGSDKGAIDTSAPSLDYFDLMVEEVLDGKPMPLTTEEELHPTRMVIRAKRMAAQTGAGA